MSSENTSSGNPGATRTWPPVSASLPSSMCCPRTSPCRLISTMYRPSTRPWVFTAQPLMSECLLFRVSTELTNWRVSRNISKHAPPHACAC